MQNSFFDCLVAAHCERQCASGVSKTPGSLQQRSPKCIGFRKFPKRGSFLGGSPVSFMHHHMEFLKQIVHENCRHHIKVIAAKPSDSDVIQIALGFQFAESIFLRPASIMKAHHLFHRRLLVRDDYLELISVLMGNEEIELNRLFGLLFDLVPDKEKPEAGVPLLGFPLRIKIRKLPIEIPPASPAIDHTLQLCEPLKRHRYRKLDTLSIKCFDSLVAEKGTVHAYLNDNAGTSGANNAHALLHEFQSTIGVMDIARAGKHIKDLACLSYCAEQRIVAPLSFLLFVKAHSCTFRHSSRAQNRPIKIKCHSYHTQSNKSCKNHLPASLPNFNYAFVVNVAQGPADCRNIRHSFESQKTQYHKVITIVIHVPEAAVSKHQMCDQYQSNHMIAIYRAYRQMIKTHTEPSLKIKIRKQLLNDNRTGKRSKPLVLEFKLRNFVDMGENLCFTIFHFQWPPDLGYFETRNSNFNQSGGRFTRSLS